MMYCPFCSKVDTKVIESRILNESIRRRRECLNCTNRFTTYETAKIHFKVIKRDGKEQEFDLNKIEKSISKACGKIQMEQCRGYAGRCSRGYFGGQFRAVAKSEYW